MARESTMRFQAGSDDRWGCGAVPKRRRSVIFPRNPTRWLCATTTGILWLAMVPCSESSGEDLWMNRKWGMNRRTLWNGTPNQLPNSPAPLFTPPATMGGTASPSSPVPSWHYNAVGSNSFPFARDAGSSECPCIEEIAPSANDPIPRSNYQPILSSLLSEVAGEGLAIEEPPSADPAILPSPRELIQRSPASQESIPSDPLETHSLLEPQSPLETQSHEELPPPIPRPGTLPDKLETRRTSEAIEGLVPPSYPPAGAEGPLGSAGITKTIVPTSKPWRDAALGVLDQLVEQGKLDEAWGACQGMDQIAQQLPAEVRLRQAILGAIHGESPNWAATRLAIAWDQGLAIRPDELPRGSLRNYLPKESGELLDQTLDRLARQVLQSTGDDAAHRSHLILIAGLLRLDGQIDRSRLFALRARQVGSSPLDRFSDFLAGGRPRIATP